MPKLFQQALSSVPAAAFSLKNVKLTVGGQPTKGALIQNITFNFAQQANNLGEVGSDNFYYLVGRRSGTGRIQQLFGPTDVVLNIWQTYGDPCQVIQNQAPDWVLTYNNAAQCTNPNAIQNQQFNQLTLTLSGILLTSVQVGLQSENPFISLDATFQFADLDFQTS